MKRMTAVIVIALSAASFSDATARDAQVAASAPAPFRAFSANRPLGYRFVAPQRRHAVAPRHHRHHIRHRHHRHRFFQPLPILTGPAVIYRNGDIDIPEEEITGAIEPPVAAPVIHRLGETGDCNLQQVNVRGSRGRTTVNIWRC